MTKQQIREVLPNSDWIDKLQYATRAEALAYIETLPDYVTFEIDYYGYDCESAYGELSYTREETDEEYSTRLAKEVQEQLEREARQRITQENQAEKMARYAVEQVALHAYLSQHEGNPQINDLENLFRSVQNLEAVGKAESSLKALRECMKAIEEKWQ